MKNYVFYTLTITFLCLLPSCSDDKDDPTPIEIDKYSTRDAVLDAYLLENYDIDGDKKLSEEEVLAITRIDYPYNGEGTKIGSGAQSGYDVAVLLVKYPNLTYVNLSGHNISSIAFGSNVLDTLIISGNGLTRAEWAKIPKLNYLDCSHNNLERLDYFKLGETLRYLDFSYNKISRIESDNTDLISLSYFNCSNNLLEVLNVQLLGSSILKTIICNNNKLSVFQPTYRTMLDYIDISDNAKINELDISKNLIIQFVKCTNIATDAKIVVNPGQNSKYNEVGDSFLQKDAEAQLEVVSYL